MNHKFIIMWDNTGLEYIGDATPDLQTRMWDTLRGANPKDFSVANPMHLRLRAQANPQRHYEIYAIDCVEDMDEAFWREQWEEYPQSTAELIRERGHKLYSDRVNTNQIKIT